jgi:tRNA-dihydrouridine synthase
MFDECLIRQRRFAPARFCAPLAGYTHSAFRRLVADFGGCGALWTEMLAARQVLGEDFQRSPWLRRRPQEGFVFFQLMARAGDPVDRILPRMADHGVEAVDLNLACDAPAIRRHEAGSALFENEADLRSVVLAARRHWSGILTAKIRFGRQQPDWQTRFAERVRFLEEAGVDALILHARFFEDKFRRRVQHELFPWAASLTRLPLVANGDLVSPAAVTSLAEHLRPVAAIMIGRMAVARPWIFAAWDQPLTVDHAQVWGRFWEYCVEDFEPPVAIRRLKMFTKYFAVNFKFGHQFNSAVGSAPTLETARERAEEFLQRGPELVSEPVLAGL